MPRIITAFNLERPRVAVGGIRATSKAARGGDSPPPVALARSERGTRYLAARRGVSSG